MKKVFMALALGVFLVSFGVSSSTAFAQTKANVLIMGEDAGGRSVVPCDSPVFKRVRDALVDLLHRHGYDVFDETAVTVGDFVQGQCKRTDAELIQIARAIDRVPVDVAVVFTIYTHIDRKKFTAFVNILTTGRLLNVKTGQSFGTFEVTSPRNWKTDVDCPDNPDCILSIVGDKARILAKDLAAVLAIKLDDATVGGGEEPASPPKQATKMPDKYRLVFDGFCGDVIFDVQNSFAAFSGYVRHRPLYTSECRHEYWYETYGDSARLERNLRKMLGYIDERGRVSFTDNNVLTVEKY